MRRIGLIVLVLLMTELIDARPTAALKEFQLFIQGVMSAIDRSISVPDQGNVRED